MIRAVKSSGEFMRGFTLVALLFAIGTFPAFADIVNGNFEAGYSGFTSEYQWVNPNGGDHIMYPEGTFTVGTDPFLVHNLWTSFGPKQGSHMMIVNGDPTGNATGEGDKVVWAGEDSAGLSVGQHTFTAWVASVYSGSPAHLVFSVGDQPLGEFDAPLDAGIWVLFSANFTVAADSPLLGVGDAAPIFRIVNTNTVRTGNDFALDDIHVPEAGFYSAFALNLGGLLLFVRRRRKA